MSSLKILASVLMVGLIIGGVGAYFWAILYYTPKINGYQRRIDTLISHLSEYEKRVSDLESLANQLAKKLSDKSSQVSNLQLKLVKAIENMSSPIIKIVSPKNGSKVWGVVTIKGFYYDKENNLKEVKIRINEGEWKQIHFSDYFWSYSFNASKFGEGPCKIEVLARDRTNLASSDSIILEVHMNEIKRLLLEKGINSPELETALLNVYYYDRKTPNKVTEEEKKFIKIVLDIFKNNPRMQSLSSEELFFVVSWYSGTTHYNPEFFNNTIIPLARTFKGNNSLQIATEVYKWVNRYITIHKHLFSIVGPEYDPHDIEKIYKYRAGVCSEKSYLITAILRAAGIPARVVHSNQLNHAWVEIFFNDSWIPIPSTGVLDLNKDGYVDVQDRIAEDVMVDVSYPFSYVKYVGYKYSVYSAELILQMAKNEKLKELSEKYISLFKKARTWKDREEYGRRALQYAVNSVINSTKIYYSTYSSTEIGAETKLEPKSAIVHFYISNAIEYYNIAQDNLLGILCEKSLRGEVRDVSIIFVNVKTGKVTLLSPNQIAELTNLLNDYNDKSVKVLKDFSSTVRRIKIGEINEAYLTLPAIGDNIYLTGFGSILKEGYEYKPIILIKITFNGLTINAIFEDTSWVFFRVPDLWRYMKFINETGELVIPVNDEGYLEKCPGRLRIPFSQTLHIVREQEWIRVEGIMFLTD